MEVFPWFTAVLQAAGALYAITVLKFSQGFASFQGLVSNGQPKKCVREADQSYPTIVVILIGDQCYPMQQSILLLKKKIQSKSLSDSKKLRDIQKKNFYKFCFPGSNWITCLKLTIETIEQVWNMFKVNNKDTMTSFWYLYC